MIRITREGAFVEMDGVRHGKGAVLPLGEGDERWLVQSGQAEYVIPEPAEPKPSDPEPEAPEPVEPEPAGDKGEEAGGGGDADAAVVPRAAPKRRRR